MSRLMLCVGVAAILAIPVPAFAGQPYYFNKTGVTREAYMADAAECAELAGGAKAATPYVPYNPNPYAAAAGAFFGALMRGAETRRLKRSVERTCMADKGYNRFEVDDSVVDEIEELEEADRVDRLFSLASAAQPIGTRMPE